MVSVWICEIRGRNILVPHGPFHIQHSTFSTSLPQIYTVFPVAPRLASKYVILAHFCNRLTFNHLPSKEPVRYPTRPIPHHEKPSFAPRNMPFRTSIPYLSHLDPLAIAPRYMPNAPVTTPHPSFHTPQTAFPALYFAQNPDTRFVPKFATSNDGFRVCQNSHILSS